MNILQSLCQHKMYKPRLLATLITVFMFVTYGMCPVSTFILPSENDEMGKESTQMETTSENLQPTQAHGEESSIKPGITESAWLRDFQNLEQQNIEATRGNESKESQSLKTATGENSSALKSSPNSSKPKIEKPSRRGKKNDAPLSRSGMLRNSEALTASRESSKLMTPSIGYMSLEERIAAWLLANKKENTMWSGHSDEEDSNPRQEDDDSSLLLHVDKVQNYGNTRSSYPYDEDQPSARGYGNSGGFLDDTLHAYHFNNEFMNNGLFPSFEGQEGYKNYMDMGKSQRSKGKDRSNAPSLYDKLEAKRNNNDAAKLHFAYYYDPESHYGAPAIKPPYPFFDKQYGMDDVFPFDGMGIKEKKPQHPKNTRKSQTKEHENNSFFTLENYLEDSAANRNDALNREGKNVKVNTPQDNKSKPPTTKQPGTNKKANTPNNAAQSVKKAKAKVDHKETRALNASKRTGLNNETKAEFNFSSSISNSSLNMSKNGNVSANSKDSAVGKHENHTELEEVLKGGVQNRSETDENKNGTVKSVPGAVQASNTTSFPDTSTENKTSLTSASANMETPAWIVKNENNSNIQKESSERQSNNSLDGELSSVSNLTVQSDSKLRESKLETGFSQSNATNVDKKLTNNFTNSEISIESKSNSTKDQMSTLGVTQPTQESKPATPTYGEPERITTTEPNLISQKNVTDDVSYNHKEPNSVATATNATIKNILEIKSNFTSENISARSDGIVNESTSYSHRNSTNFKTSESQGDKAVMLNETWNFEIVNATDLKALDQPSTGKNDSVVNELLNSFSTAREQNNSGVKPLATTEASMNRETNESLGDKPNTFTTSTDSVGFKNVEQSYKNQDMNTDKMYVSNSAGSELRTGGDVLLPKQNGTGASEISSGNSTHYQSLLEVVGGDKKIEELAPKGTEREEKSIPSEGLKTQVNQHQNTTEPESLRNSEDVMSRMEIFNVTAESIRKVNASSATPADSMNKSTTTDNSLSGDRPNFEINGNSTAERALNSSVSVNSPAARSAEQKSQEPTQALEPNQIFNFSQSNQTNDSVAVKTLRTVENITSSWANATKTGENLTNTTSELDGIHTTALSTDGDILRHLAVVNSPNTSETVASAQHKSLTSKFSSDLNVSRKLFGLDNDVPVNGTEQNNDRAVTEAITQQDFHGNSSSSLNKTDILSSLLSGNRSESIILKINSTAETKQRTSLENHTTSDNNYTSTESSGDTTTASSIMPLPEALPNSEVLVGKQINDYKPQLENIGPALQAFSDSLNGSVPNNNSLPQRGLHPQNTSDAREKQIVESVVKAENSSLNASVFLNVTDANVKLTDHEVKADSPKSFHSLNDSSSVNKGSLSAAASANAKEATPTTKLTSDTIRKGNNQSLSNNTSNDDSKNKTFVINVVGVASHELQSQDSNITSLQKRSADGDFKAGTVEGREKTPSAVNASRNSTEEAKSQNSSGELRQLDASPEEDIPPISAYMIQDFSLRKVTPEVKNAKENNNKPKENTTQGSDNAKVDSKQGATNASAPQTNLTSRAAEAQCLGPACDLVPLSAVSRSQAAVSAVLTTHFGPSKDIMVPFDLELLDLADNYDNSTGMFICTVPGTYVISLYLMSHPGAKVNARIFVNNRPIAALWADDSKNAGFYPSSSTQTIAQLGFGDQVYVMLVDGGYGESWVHANYNVFTIFLLYEQVF